MKSCRRRANFRARLPPRPGALSARDKNRRKKSYGAGRERKKREKASQGDLPLLALRIERALDGSILPRKGSNKEREGIVGWMRSAEGEGEKPIE